MLRVRSLDVENFGPYYGLQSINFGGKDGVIVVFGENMRGKTSLLNAIRFALFGKILGRGEREIEAHKLLNLQAKKEGASKFTVSLRLEKDGTMYDIVRSCNAPDTDNSEITIETVLFVGGEPQSQNRTAAILAELLPEQISRFFLFDGELLQQYEELLLDESEAARGIRESIESILGLPVLIHGREDLATILDDVRRAETRSAKKHKATEALASQLEILNAKLLTAKEQAKQIKNEIAELTKQREETEDLLGRSAKIEALLARRNSIEEDIDSLETQQEELSQSLSKMLAVSWHWPLIEGLNGRKRKLTNEYVELRGQIKAIERESHLKDLRSTAKKESKCPVCFGVVNPDADLEFSNRSAIRGDFSVLQTREEQVLGQINLLNQLTLDDHGPAAVEVSRQLHQLKMELQVKRTDHGDVMAQLLTSPTKEVEGARQTLGHIIAAVQKHKATLAVVQKEINDFESSIATAQQKLRATGEPSLSLETRRREIVEGLRDAFARAVDRYRDELRGKVEADASELFKKLTTEPDYERLVINKNYGLQIQHKDGFMVEVRSSGAEHIVALSLVGALQANAPLRGPLFIDSPFGRLDENHVERVVRSLPDMAKQVVLLVYKKEMSEHVARDMLKSKLLSEYELKRISAIHTEIERFSGDGL